MNKRLGQFLTMGLIAASLLVTACSAATASTTKPAVAITSPPSNSQFRDGETVAVQSTSNDPAGIQRVELLVDGITARADASPTSQTAFTLLQLWKATPGVHTLMVRAINANGDVSDEAAVTVIVLGSTPTPAATVSRECTSNAAFVADVTVPDGTVFAAGQPFNKIWRMRNTGTCSWGGNAELSFVRGEAMTPQTIAAVPATPAGGTADILIAMAAPATPGTHIGEWRMRIANGASFGPTIHVTINVPGTSSPPSSSCPWTPQLKGEFTIAPTTIKAGESATLTWGFVEGAEKAEIDNGIGGVQTPGSATVTPNQTTTYTLTGTCQSKMMTWQVTITVNPSQ